MTTKSSSSKPRLRCLCAEHAECAGVTAVFKVLHDRRGNFCPLPEDAAWRTAFGRHLRLSPDTLARLDRHKRYFVALHHFYPYMVDEARATFEKGVYQIPPTIDFDTILEYSMPISEEDAAGDGQYWVVPCYPWAATKADAQAAYLRKRDAQRKREELKAQKELSLLEMNKTKAAATAVAVAADMEVVPDEVHMRPPAMTRTLDSSEPSDMIFSDSASEEDLVSPSVSFVSSLTESPRKKPPKKSQHRGDQTPPPSADPVVFEDAASQPSRAPEESKHSHESPVKQKRINKQASETTPSKLYEDAKLAPGPPSPHRKSRKRRGLGALLPSRTRTPSPDKDRRRSPSPPKRMLGAAAKFLSRGRTPSPQKDRHRSPSPKPRRDLVGGSTKTQSMSNVLAGEHPKTNMHASMPDLGWNGSMSSLLSSPKPPKAPGTTKVTFVTSLPPANLHESASSLASGPNLQGSLSSLLDTPPQAPKPKAPGAKPAQSPSLSNFLAMNESSTFKRRSTGPVDLDATIASGDEDDDDDDDEEEGSKRSGESSVMSMSATGPEEEQTNAAAASAFAAGAALASTVAVVAVVTGDEEKEVSEAASVSDQAEDIFADGISTSFGLDDSGDLLLDEEPEAPDLPDEPELADLLEDEPEAPLVEEEAANSERTEEAIAADRPIYASAMSLPSKEETSDEPAIVRDVAESTKAAIEACTETAEVDLAENTGMDKTSAEAAVLAVTNDATIPYLSESASTSSEAKAIEPPSMTELSAIAAFPDIADGDDADKQSVESADDQGGKLSTPQTSQVRVATRGTEATDVTESTVEDSDVESAGRSTPSKAVNSSTTEHEHSSSDDESDEDDHSRSHYRSPVDVDKMTEAFLSKRLSQKTFSPNRAFGSTRVALFTSASSDEDDTHASESSAARFEAIRPLKRLSEMPTERSEALAVKAAIESKRRCWVMNQLQVLKIEWRCHRALLTEMLKDLMWAEELLENSYETIEVYGVMLKALHCDSLLDDEDQLVGIPKQRKKLIELRRKKERKLHKDAVSDTLMAPILDAVMGIVTKIEESLPALAEDWDEVNELHDEIEARAKVVLKAGDEHVYKIEVGESKIQEAWASFMDLDRAVSAEIEGGGCRSGSQDRWIAEIKYEQSVKDGMSSFKARCDDLQQVWKDAVDLDVQRRNRTKQVLLSFLPRRRRLFLRMLEVYDPAVTKMHDDRLGRDKIDYELNQVLEKLSRRNISKRNRSSIMNRSRTWISGGDATPASNPLPEFNQFHSQHVVDRKVLEVKTGAWSPWKVAIGVVTVDDYLHIIVCEEENLPENTTNSAESFNAESQLESALAEKLNGTPPELTVALFECRSSILPGKDEIELAIEGSSTLQKMLKKKVHLRLSSARDTAAWYEAHRSKFLRPSDGISPGAFVAKV